MNNKISYYFKKIYLKIWYKFNSSQGNVHLDFKSSILKKIPFTDEKIYLRPTNSDCARLVEFNNAIYFQKNFFHEKLKKESPSILIDLGANIGTSSLSIIKEFKSIKKVIGVEAERFNYEILENNYRLWEEKFKSIDFYSIFGAASCEEGISFNSNFALSNENSKYSASGTFIFNSTKDIDDKFSSVDSISLNHIIAKYCGDEKIICKIDIEGGEKNLFEKNNDWLKNVAFITIEIHDRFDKKLVDSSKNLLKILQKYNFAIVPDKDVLYCYSREILSD
jgi:FkbM family methyltransferase